LEPEAVESPADLELVLAGLLSPDADEEPESEELESLEEEEEELESEELDSAELFSRWRFLVP
jgi:hypothetical protein